MLTDVMARGLRIVRVSNTPQTPNTPPPTSVVFYSCRIGERAYENPELQHGIFTYYILRGIRELAARPAGGVEAGLLAGYLSTNVRKWAAEYGQRAKLPIEQTPTMIATEVHGPVYVVTVSPFANSAPNAPTTGVVTLAASPENALISINGQPAGSGPLQKELPPRQYTVRAELPGFQPAETRINVLPGYQQEITLTLQPAAAPASYERGVQFENQQLWPQAIASYEQALREDASAVAVYERLANVYVKNTRYRDAVTLMTSAVQKFPNNAALLARRSRALSAWAESERQPAAAVAEPTAAPQPASQKLNEDDEPPTKKGGKKKKKADAEDARAPSAQFGNSFVAPQKSGKKKKDAAEDEPAKGKKSKKNDAEPRSETPPSRSVAVPSAAAQDNIAAAIRDAEAAVQKDANLAAAQLALGFAYLLDPQQQTKAMTAFVRASTLTPDDPEAYFGVGYAYRLQQQCQQAIPQLRKAIELRPDYYEAQRELASCYLAQGQTDQAIKQYQVVSSQRRKTKSSDEMAANNLALSTAYRKKGEEVGGVQGEEYKKASKGYETEAREYDPSLKGAVKKLKDAGVAKFIQSLLPDDARRESESDSGSGSSGGIKINIPGKTQVTVPSKLLDNGPVKVPVKIPEKVLEKVPVTLPGKNKVKTPVITLPGKDTVKAPVKGKGKVSSKAPLTEKVKSSVKTKESASKSVKNSVKLPVKNGEREPEKAPLKLPIKKLLN
jgi:tetratricopeptide (TPR) repeat protein